MQFKKINFSSKDGLIITADLYKVNKAKGFILLCHRSHCNRAEYRKTAPKLNALGYSCMAIDQRSGMKVWGEVNETKIRAKEQGLPTGYLDAKPDIEAAIDKAYSLNKKNKIILFGSSYSASLALLISTESDKLLATMAFSPGEYLKGIKLAQKLKTINKPTYVTSAQKEIKQVMQLIKYINSNTITQFKPIIEGFHGSKTLWESVPGNQTYWNSLEKFLNSIPDSQIR